MAEEKFEKVEFEFPDEKEQPAPPAPEAQAESNETIEVVDDTPEKDRGRTPMKEPPPEITDDEMADYSDKVRKRIQHFSKGYHDERRAKEAALREREEAIRLAQQTLEENKRLKASVGQNQTALLEQAKKSLDLELAQAKAAYKKAYEAGDSDAIVAAQDALTAARVRAERLAEVNVKNTRQREQAAVETQQQVQQAQPQQPATSDPKALAWQRENQWFGSDEEMTGFALALHNKLVTKEGIDPRSDDYYRRINARMREKFPEAFGSVEPEDTGVEETTPQPKRAKPNVVAPATRSTAPKKIVLTQTQVAIAKRLGVPLEVYARQVAELGK